MNTSIDFAGGRYDFLDWLRVLAIFILLFFHTGMLFVGWDWHIQNSETLPALVLPMGIAHRLRMPLLFVIAGAGLWFSLGRRGGLEVVRERSVRLLLPLVAGMFLIVPPQVWYERLFRGQWQGSYIDFLLHRVLQFQPYPQGDFSWHHLWFIAYLYVYVLLFMPALVAWRRRTPSLRPGAWLLLGALPLGINEALLKPHFPETHALIGDWYIFNHYLLLTLYGFVLASMPGSWDWLARWRHRLLGVAVAVFVLTLGAIDVGLIHRGTSADSLSANLFTWCWVLVFLAYGRQHLSFCNGLLRWAREASYPVYILHQTVIVVIGYYVVQMSWGPWAKYAVVLAATMAICAVSYETIVRRFTLTRVLFGLKPLTGKARIVASGSTPDASSA